MRRLFYLTLLLLAASLPVWAKDVSVNGTFMTSFGGIDEIEMTLIQDGKKVTGFYAHDNGKIEGELKGRILTGRWTEDEASGRFEFEFSKNGESFDGHRTTGDVEPTSKSDEWDGVMLHSKFPRGCWVLVGKETDISRPSFTINHSMYYDDGSTDILPYTYSLEGTVEDYTVRIKSDYHHSYVGDDSHQHVDDIAFDVTFKGGFQPLEDYYLENSDVYCTFSRSQKGTLPKECGINDNGIARSNYAINPGYLSSFPSNHLVYREGVRIEPGRYENVFDVVSEPDIVYDKSDVPVAALGNKPTQAKISFPYHKYNETPGGSPDDLYICLGINFAEQKEKGNSYYYEVDYIGTVYHYRWNGDAVGVISSGDKSTGWFHDLFGGWKHTNDLWTILLSLGAGVLVIGAIGGAFPEDSAGNGLPDGPDDETPDELSDEKKQGFIRDDDPDYVRKNVHENDDGSLTLTDPGGGPTLIMYPKLDSDGNRIGWFSQNFTEYDDDDIREWTRWRTENAGTFIQDTEQSERNVAEQRAMNEARDQIDRDRGSTQTADEVRQWEKRQERLQKLGDHFGIDPVHEEALKKAILKEMKQNAIEGAEAAKRAAWWDERIAEAELTEKVCDTIIDTVGEASPETKAIKEQYHYYKTIGQRTMEGIVERKGAGHLLVKMGQGFAENTIDSVSGSDKWKEFKTLNKLTGGSKGRAAGSEMLKTVMGDLIDGDKSTSEVIDDAVKSGVSKFGSDLIGDALGSQVDKAELTYGATKEHAQMVKTLYGDWLSKTVSDPISEGLSGKLNEWRKAMLGV